MRKLKVGQKWDMVRWIYIMNLNCDYKGIFYLIVLILPDDLLKNNLIEKQTDITNKH